MPSNKEYQNIKLISQEFEKDDDSNWHVAWVNASSNLRAMNYGIPPVSFQETKGIAGRIIPAIATTTSVVSGLIVIEMMKYMLYDNPDKKNNETKDFKYIYDKIENHRSTFVNLADTTLVYSEPMIAKQVKIAGLNFNSWTKFKCSDDLKLCEFKATYERLFKTTISMIVYDNAILYSDFTSEEDGYENTLVSKLILDKTPNINLKDNSVIINIASNEIASNEIATNIDDEVELPEIHFSI